ncbi:MAG: hypothetical protein JAZ11_19990 [Candidatus Thiodiazotropha lotti]|nr:hypothetical protein [Candidatus Thiodiazotropha lotti]
MLGRILLRFRDMKTIAKLIPGADKEANMMGEEKPGAEHFVLSALDLEDGTARRTLDRFEIDSRKFRDAIKAQYEEALSSIGISQKSTDFESEPIEADRVIHDSKPSGQDLMKSLYALKQEEKGRPLLGAHVIIVASAIEHGVVPRALRILGVDRTLLKKVAKEELDSAKW